MSMLLFCFYVISDGGGGGVCRSEVIVNKVLAMQKEPEKRTFYYILCRTV